MDPLYAFILYPIIYIFPAYVANGAPVIFGAGSPIDMNMKFRKKPILGKNKTVRGLFAGILSGIIIGAAESLSLNYMFSIGVMLSIGAQFGDLLGSFIKRRINIKEGERVLFLDQYPFLIFAMLFALPLGHFPNLYGILFIFILTGILHPLTNKIAHVLRIKRVPW